MSTKKKVAVAATPTDLLHPSQDLSLLKNTPANWTRLLEQNKALKTHLKEGAKVGFDMMEEHLKSAST